MKYVEISTAEAFKALVEKRMSKKDIHKLKIMLKDTKYAGIVDLLSDDK